MAVTTTLLGFNESPWGPDLRMSLTKELLRAPVARSRGRSTLMNTESAVCGVMRKALEDELSAGEKKTWLLREVWAHPQKGDDQ